MALASSGSISIGGSTSGRSINLELGRSASTSSNLNESALRSLAQRSSGSISLSHFHGKSNQLWSFSVTNGYYYDEWCMLKSCTPYRLHGYANYWNGHLKSPPSQFHSNSGYGTTNDSTCNFKSGATLKQLSWKSTLGTSMKFGISGNHSNSGFTSMKINSTTFYRTAATLFSYDSATNQTIWHWEAAVVPQTGGSIPNPFTTSGWQTVVFA